MALNGKYKIQIYSEQNQFMAGILSTTRIEMLRRMI